jgi:competence protein ComEC
VLRNVLHCRLRRSVLVIGFCLALFAGVFFARRYPVLPDFWWVLLCAVPVLVTVRRHGWLALCCLVLFAFILGLQRGSVYMQKLAVHESLHYQKVVLTGTATDDAVYGKRYQLEFALSNIVVAEPVRTPIIGSLTIRGFGEAAIYRGDKVQVSGKLYPTLGNNLGTISFGDLQVIERDSSVLNDLRRRFAAGMQSALPEPAASFALGLLIGQRTTLPDDIDEQLRHVGLTHIIAVSGYNLTVIVMACRRLLANRSKFQATATCLALIAVFLLITGSSPPIVRAGIISVLGIAAWYYGRDIKPMVLLLAGAAVTVIANPVYLWGNVSWYLSFLAFFGVLVLAPLITRRIFGKREPPMLLGIMIETICATIFVLPYVLFIFGETSLVSLPANLLVVPFIPLAMLLGLLAGLGGMLVPVIAGWLAWPAATLLTYMLDIAALLSKIPKSYVEGIGFSWQFLSAAYGTIGVLMLILWHRTRSVAAKTRASLPTNNQLIREP